MKQRCYENYPFWFVFIATLLQLSIYFIGIMIMSTFGVIVISAYLLYLIWLETKLLRNSCTNCYYYGKYCAFGRGKLSGLFFKKGNADKFTHCKITWKDILPDFMVSIIPIVSGIALLILRFDWTLLILMILLFLLTTFGNGLVRGSLACKHCKQRELGCPAEKLFDKKKDKKA